MNAAGDEGSIPPPPMSKPGQYSSMDPLLRERFHEMGNYLMVLHGVVVGLSMRVPRDPAVVPVLEQRVGVLEQGHQAVTAQVKQTEEKLGERVDRIETRLGEKVDALADRVGALTAKVAGVTAIVVVIVDVAMRKLA